MVAIRPATVSDVPLLLRFSRELAEYERQPDAVVINEETLVRDGFGSQPKFRSLIAVPVRRIQIITRSCSCRAPAI